MDYQEILGVEVATDELSGSGLAVLGTSALAQAVYRYKDSQGNTVYTDKPPAGNDTVQRIETPPPPAPSPARRT